MPRITIDAANAGIELPHGARLLDIDTEFIGGCPIAFGCRAGKCGICLIEVRLGNANLGGRSADEAEFIRRLGHDPENHRLACRCTVEGDVSLRPVGRLARSRRQACA